MNKREVLSIVGLCSVLLVASVNAEANNNHITQAELDAALSGITSGVDGTDGTDGVDGKRGKRGKRGFKGTNGVDGNDGTNGTNGTNGVDGNEGIQGSQGGQGSAGIDGINGVAGLNGISGISLTAALHSFDTSGFGIGVSGNSDNFEVSVGTAFTFSERGHILFGLTHEQSSNRTIGTAGMGWSF